MYPTDKAWKSGRESDVTTFDSSSDRYQATYRRTLTSWQATLQRLVTFPIDDFSVDRADEYRMLVIRKRHRERAWMNSPREGIILGRRFRWMTFVLLGQGASDSDDRLPLGREGRTATYIVHHSVDHSADEWHRRLSPYLVVKETGLVPQRRLPTTRILGR